MPAQIMLTPAEVAALLGTSADHVRALATTGRLVGVNVGTSDRYRVWRFTPAAVEAFQRGETRVVRVAPRKAKASALPRRWSATM